MDGAGRIGLLVAALVASSSAGCGLLLSSDAPVAEGPTELCNGLDDDGDGLVDEDVVDPEVGVPCFDGAPALAGIGQCVEGRTACLGGAVTCEGSGAPTAEICDGVDNDCDGALAPEEAGGRCGVATPERLRVELLVEPAQPDVHVNFDTSGSMGPELDSLQRDLLSSGATNILASTPGAAFGLSTFDDFPISPVGSFGDRPFFLHQRITADLAVLGAALARPMLHGGGDGDESGVEALYQVATGAGRTWTSTSGVPDMVPPMDCGVGFDASQGHGTVGGVCFRPESLPLVVHVTDDKSHEAWEYASYGITAASAPEAMDALHAIGARVIGLRSGSFSISTGDRFDPHYPEGMALATGSVVPVCAFDDSEPRRASVCARDSCCTGISGASRRPAPGLGCPMVFDYGASGAEIVPATVAAVNLLTRFTPRSLSIALADDPADGVDATCFVESVELESVDDPPGGCGAPAVSRDADGDGLDDTADGVIAGERVRFQLSLINADTRDVDGDGDRVEPCAPIGDYPLEVTIVSNGVTVLATQTEIITVR